jgi:hypothetical protein
MLWTVARRPGRTSVRVRRNGEIREVPVDAHGWWVIAEDRDGDRTFPRVLD